jgi:AAA15 family ATPase/GTPase
MSSPRQHSLTTSTPQLRVANVGPIQEAAVSFGDLTVLVGPQATGKSLFLQTLKLLLDAAQVRSTMAAYGVNPAANPELVLESYFGEGTAEIWNVKKSVVSWEANRVLLPSLLSPPRGQKQIAQGTDRAFLIPAQRILALDRAGWVRGFADYAPGDPFVVRDFSEKIRRQLDSSPARADAVFPQSGRLKSEIRDAIAKAIFGNYQLEVDQAGLQKRFVLSADNHAGKLPFMVWSAGQREFMPLLLGLYWLLPPSRIPRRDSIQWVLIEELEMGLHPLAIEALMATILDLLHRGYRICLSTHSPTVLEFVWAIQTIRSLKASIREPAAKLRKLLDLPSTRALNNMASSALEKVIRVYYFSKDTGRVSDISELDPDSDDNAQAAWGGLAGFGSRAATIIADAVSEASH